MRKEEAVLADRTCKTYDVGGLLVRINHGPEMREIKRESKGVKWCFHCRKRREFFFTVMAPVVPDYYGPNADIRCDHCNTSDGDLFPGNEREWE